MRHLPESLRENNRINKEEWAEKKNGLKTETNTYENKAVGHVEVEKQVGRKEEEEQ